MTEHETQAITLLKSFTSDPSKFLVRQRGFIDYKFSELARYKGYEAAIQYAESVRRWHDFERYKDCLLETSYAAFLVAAGEAECH